MLDPPIQRVGACGPWLPLPLLLGEELEGSVADDDFVAAASTDLGELALHSFLHQLALKRDDRLRVLEVRLGDPTLDTSPDNAESLALPFHPETLTAGPKHHVGRSRWCRLGGRRD